MLGQLGLQESVIVGAWYIWWKRREAAKGKKIADPSHMALAIHAITANVGKVANPVDPPVPKWSKPPKNSYKQDVDASYFENGTRVSGAVLRNDRGEAVASASWLLHHLFDATTAEASALQKGLLFAQDLGCSPIVIESVSLELIQACNGVIEIWSPYTAILADCFQIEQNIGAVSFLHCPSESNMVAHNLARFTYDSL